MITVNRFLSVLTMALGGGLLLWLIPANVIGTGTIVMNPALFPNIAAWLLIGLGAIQFLTTVPRPDPPPFSQFLRFGLVILLTIAAVILMPRLGFIPTSMGLMTVLALVVHERRPIWLAVMIVGLPVGIWGLFEWLLGRPLP